MNVNNIQIGTLTPSGEATASGREFCKDRGLGQVQHYPGTTVIDSLARDSRGAPTTVLQRGLALDLTSATGRWTHHTNASGTAKGVLDNEKGLDLRDAAGNAQNNDNGKIMIRGLVDKALVVDTNGTAIDAAGIANLGDSPGTNGCCIMAQAT